MSGPADRRVQPVPPAARRVPPERPDVRLRGGRPPRRPRPRRARVVPRRVDDRRARRRRLSDAGDIRYRLVQQLLREGAKRGAARFHVACADEDGNVELLMQAGFMRYGEEAILARPADGRCPEPWTGQARRRLRDPAGRAARRACRSPACTRRATPQPVDRLEAIRLADWERQGDALAGPALQPRPDPALRRRRGASSRRRPDGGKDGTELDAFVQIGVAKEDQPHYLKVIARPEADSPPSSASGSGSSPPGPAKGGASPRTTGSSRPCGPTNRRSTGDWRKPASTRSPASRC